MDKLPLEQPCGCVHVSSAQEMEQAEQQPHERGGSSATMPWDESGHGCSFEPLFVALPGLVIPTQHSARYGAGTGSHCAPVPFPCGEEQLGAVGRGHSGCAKHHVAAGEKAPCCNAKPPLGPLPLTPAGCLRGCLPLGGCGKLLDCSPTSPV